MSKLGEHAVSKAVDTMQQRITDYASGLNYESLPPEAIDAAKVRVIDTLGALIAGFFAEPCLVARNIAARVPKWLDSEGSTVIGTRIKTTPEMAAFVNATAARFPELNDTNHWPGSSGGHPSDVITPVLAAAEYMLVNGREFITSVVLAYEVFLRIADVYQNRNFDYTTLSCLSIAVAAGKLLGLRPDQLSHAISMAVVANNSLRQSRMGHISHWKAAASGQAGRAGIYAALLAQAGMEGPYLPFEGKAGWFDHVARERLTLSTMGGNGTPFRISNTLIKMRMAAGGTQSSILAAEKLAPLRNIKDVKQITVEVYKKSKENTGTGEHRWNPDSPESADHSNPYVIAATLMDGTITPRSYNEAHLRNPELRALMQKIKIVENADFTEANSRLPQEHRTRITVVHDNGEQLVGESGGDQDDIAMPRSKAQIEDKFHRLTDDVLGQRSSSILDMLWHLEDLDKIADIPTALVFA